MNVPWFSRLNLTFNTKSAMKFSNCPSNRTTLHNFLTVCTHSGHSQNHASIDNFHNLFYVNQERQIKEIFIIWMRGFFKTFNACNFIEHKKHNLMNRQLLYNGTIDFEWKCILSLEYIFLFKSDRIEVFGSIIDWWYDMILTT